MIDSQTVKELIDRMSNEDRFHMAKDRTKKRDVVKQKTASFKPMGLWYDFGGAWLEWCLCEEESWLEKYIHKIEVDKTKLLVLSTIKEVCDFQDRFNLGTEEKPFLNQIIDWESMSQVYSGIEINPYFDDLRFSISIVVGSWYYAWDVPSGCIWNPDCITKISLFHVFE